MDFELNKNYEGENILIKIKGKKEPKILIKTSAKCAYYKDDEGRMRYSTFKKVSMYDPEIHSPVKTKSRFPKTVVRNLNILGGHMPHPPDNCKRPQQIVVDPRTGIPWIDLSICTIACKKKCKRWEEYKKERKKMKKNGQPF